MKTSKIKSVAALCFAILAAGAARADYYGRSNRPHGHTSNVDGGTLGNVSITGNLTAAGVLSAAYPILIAVDEKPSGTNGGTFTSGAWQTRDLNTLQVNTIPGASLSSNQISLPAGTYYATWTAPGYTIDEHQSRFVSTPTATITVYGTSEHTNSTVFLTTQSEGAAVFTIGSTTLFELQHRTQFTRATDGLGDANTFGNVQIYSIVQIWKIK